MEEFPMEQLGFVELRVNVLTPQTHKPLARPVREIAYFEKPRRTIATFFDVWIKFARNKYACVEMLYYPIETEALRKKSDFYKIRQGQGTTWKELGVSRKEIIAIKTKLRKSLQTRAQQYVGENICIESPRHEALGMMGVWVSGKEEFLTYCLLLYYQEKEQPFMVGQMIGKSWRDLGLSGKEISRIKKHALKKFKKFFEPRRQTDLFEKI